MHAWTVMLSINGKLANHFLFCVLTIVRHRSLRIEHVDPRAQPTQDGGREFLVRGQFCSEDGGRSGWWEGRGGEGIGAVLDLMMFRGTDRCIRSWTLGIMDSSVK